MLVPEVGVWEHPPGRQAPGTSPGTEQTLGKGGFSKSLSLFCSLACTRS